MNIHRLLALALIAVEATAVALMSRTLVFPLIAVGISIAGCFFSRPITLSVGAKAAIHVVLAVVYLANWLLFPLTGQAMPASYLGSFAAMHALAKFLMAAQILEFFAVDAHEEHAPPGSGWLNPPNAFPFSGVVVMACISSAFADDALHWKFAFLAGLFSLFFVLYFGIRHHKPAVAMSFNPERAAAFRRVALIAVTAVGISCGILTSLGVRKTLPAIDQWVEQLISPPESKGYSESGLLDSIESTQQSDAGQIALRVQSSTMPGYLRAVAFAGYTNSEWKPSTSATLLRVTTGSVFDAEQDRNLPGHTFALRRSTGRSSGTMNVWQIDEDFANGLLFLPLSATHVRLEAESLRTDSHLSVRLLRGTAVTRYQVSAAGDDAESPGQTILDPLMRQICIQIPPELTATLERTASNLFHEKQTSGEKIAAVEKWFSSWKYKFGIRVPEGREPLEWFLENRPPAHCEFFASAATLLLRHAGIPARYVTGFVAAERNQAGNYWLARNLDAHAWVEAWIDGDARSAGHWVVVEATPEEGVPGQRSTGLMASVWDYLSFMCVRLKTLVKQGDLTGALRILATAIRNVIHSAVFLVTLAVLLTVVIIKLFWKSGKRRRTTFEIETAAALNRLLVRVDKHMSQFGLHRAPAETLLRFASRIEAILPDSEAHRQAAHWYRQYAVLRFTRPDDPEAVRELNALAHKLSGK